MGNITRTINAAGQAAARSLNTDYTEQAMRHLDKYQPRFRVGDHVWLPPRTDAQGSEQEPRQAKVTAVHPVNDQGVRRYTVQDLSKDADKRWVTMWDESALTLVEVKW